MNAASMRLVAACCLAACLLAACGGQATRWEPATRAGSQSGVYTVQRGDTLYQIAFRHGLDWRELARWNGLDGGELIYPGQRLRLSPPGGARQAAASPAQGGRSDTRAAPGASPRAPTPARPVARAAEPAPRWAWPAQGQLAYGFGADGALGRGVGVSGSVGQPVLAAAPGRVVYTGGGLVGYGEVIIVKHNDTYLSAYGHTRNALVAEGDRVDRGQRIAAMGEGPGRRALLHFEIRINGEPVDPLPLLPGR